MLRRHILIILVIATVGATGQTFRQQLDSDLASGRITETEALYYEALRTHALAMLPSVYQDLDTDYVKCAVHLHARIREQWDTFTLNQKSMLETHILARPSLEASLQSPSGRFRIHYSTTGVDAVPSEDADANGVPDYVEEAVLIADYVYTVVVEEMGFQPPPDDLDVDGPEWDIYIASIGRVYGYSVWETQLTSTPDTWTSYMNVHNDYSTFDTQGLDALRVTIAHEFHHMVQWGYNWRTNGGYPDLYILEASSTYIEDVCYDNVNDYYFYLDTFFNRTNMPFKVNSGLRMYGLCIWFHFLEARLGHRNALRLTWEHIVDVEALDATVLALANLGRSFEEELALFYGWNYMTGSRADEMQFYPEGSYYPEIQMDGVYEFENDMSFTANVRETASRYYRFDEVATLYTVIPTNINLPGEETTRECVLEVVRGNNHPLYKMLGNGVMTRISSDDTKPWWGVAVVESDGSATFHSFQEVDLTLSASIGGMVWEDENADGVHDAGETTGIGDAILSLTGAGDDGLFDTEDDFSMPVRVSDTDGRYCFDQLIAGLYRIQIDPSSIDDKYISTSGGDPLEYWVGLEEEIDNADFGFRQFAQDNLPASIPNPFIAGEFQDVRIPFFLDEAGLVRISLFSASGFKVFDTEFDYDTEGMHMYRWDGRDVNGEIVPSGVYVYLVVQDVNLIRREKLAVVR